MCGTGRIDATVVAAVPWFPGAYRDWVSVPVEEEVVGLRTRHPRYLQVPAIGMRLQPDSLARALRDDLRRIGADANRFDVVDAHYFYPDGVAAARIAQLLGLPLVISARGSDINLIGEIPFARRRMLGAAARAQALIAVSGALSKAMKQIGMPGDRIHVLRNGVDPNVFFPVPRSDARQRLRLDERGHWILGVGNLVPEKGFDLLIRAVAALKHARLLIIGQGPVLASLRSQADAIAPGRVTFRDNMPQSELRVAYSACDVLGVPSVREGWPNVVLEAIACGTPVVASLVGGIPEMLGREAPALMVPVRDAEHWATALDSMLGAGLQPETVHRYALQFGWENVVAAQCALYERVAADSKRHAGRSP